VIAEPFWPGVLGGIVMVAVGIAALRWRTSLFPWLTRLVRRYVRTPRARGSSDQAVSRVLTLWFAALLTVGVLWIILSFQQGSP
jgi:uncharacterized membrane protein HdeD (DUF308 family)